MQAAGKVRVLSSPEKRFWYAKRDREPEPPPLFRQLSRGWRPQVRIERELLSSTAPLKPTQSKMPLWNPWLWIK